MDQAIPAKQTAESTRHLVTFRIGRQVYAMPLDPVVQIVSMVSITPLPELQESVLGVIDVRGEIVPVFDLRRRVGASAADLHLYTPIILAYVEDRLVGLVVDEMLDVMGIQAGHLVGLDGLLPSSAEKVSILQGLVRVSGKMIPLLDPQQFLQPGQSRALARAMEQLANAEEEADGDADGDVPGEDPGESAGASPAGEVAEEAVRAEVEQAPAPEDGGPVDEGEPGPAEAPAAGDEPAAGAPVEPPKKRARRPRKAKATPEKGGKSTAANPAAREDGQDQGVEPGEGEEPAEAPHIRRTSRR